MDSFKCFEGSLNSVKNLKNPIQIAAISGIHIIHYANSAIYINTKDCLLIGDPEKITLSDCLRVITDKSVKTIGGFAFGSFQHPVQQLSNIYLDLTITELLSMQSGYNIYLEGSVEFFYNYVLTSVQQKLNEEDQWTLYEEYKKKFEV